MPKDKRYGVNGRSRGLIPLPGVEVPAGTRCVKIQIPDSDAAERQLFGTLYELTHWQNFDRDETHQGTLWSKAWRAAIVASVPIDKCTEDVMQTLIEFDDTCGLKWSYDGGETWTNISLSACADSEIETRVQFQVTDSVLTASLDGGVTYFSICDVAQISDVEIAGRIHFQTTEAGELQVSLDNTLTWSTIFTPPADTPLEFQQTLMDLAVSTDGGTTWTNIYEFNFILQEYEGKLQASIDGGTTYADILDVKAIADAEIAAQISFTQEGVQLYASTNGATSSLIYDPGYQLGPVPAQNPGECRTFHVHLNANQVWRSPVPVKTLSSIHVINATGGWSDGYGLGAIGPWYCPDGHVYGLGTCSGTPTPQEGDPLPGVPHMQIIGRFGEVYFDPLISEYVIGDMIVSQPFEIQANDSVLGDNLGSVDFDVVVCLGSRAWCYTFNAGTGLNTLWTSKYSLATWDTDRWQSAQRPSPYSAPFLGLITGVFDSTHVDHLRIDGYCNADMTFSGFSVFTQNVGGGNIETVVWAPNNPGDFSHQFDFNSDGVRQLEIYAAGADYTTGHHIEIISIKAWSDTEGTNPFGEDNCG